MTVGGWSHILGSLELAELHEHDTQDLYALLEDAQDSSLLYHSDVVWIRSGSILPFGEIRDSQVDGMEGGGGGICFPSQATHQELQTHRDHVYAHETHLQAHHTQLQLQGTLIQIQYQVQETRFQMQQAELAALRETGCRRQDQMEKTWHLTTRRGCRIPLLTHQPKQHDSESIQAMIYLDQALLRNSTQRRWKESHLVVLIEKNQIDGEVLPPSLSLGCAFIDLVLVDMVRDYKNLSLLPNETEKKVDKVHQWDFLVKSFLWELFKSARPMTLDETIEGKQWVQLPRNGCFEMWNGSPRHFKVRWPKLKNKDGGNGIAQGLRLQESTWQRMLGLFGTDIAKKVEDKSEGKQ
ncbi:hypothetical protein Tco_1351814 [Tanacetum coccineum]